MKSLAGKQLCSSLFMALLKKTYRDNPACAAEKSRRLGHILGLRIADDFFSSRQLFEKVPSSCLNEHIEDFLKEYFDINCIITDETLIVDHPIIQLGKECGLEFFSGLLSSVFHFLCSGAQFEVYGEHIKLKTNLKN